MNNKALSVKQPWASLIVSGIKDIENRTWKTNFIGTVLIHASKTYCNKFAKTAAQALKIPIDMKHDYSAIIGEVDIVGCVKDHSSIWAEKGSWNWILANAVIYEEPILNVKGKLGFWNYENEVELC